MRVSLRVAKLLKKLGYSTQTIDEYWILDGSIHTYIEGEIYKVKKELRISAPSPYEALSWLRESDKAYVSLDNKKGTMCICKANIVHRPEIEIEISGYDPDSAIYNCLELIERQW